MLIRGNDCNKLILGMDYYIFELTRDKWFIHIRCQETRVVRLKVTESSWNSNGRGSTIERRRCGGGKHADASGPSRRMRETGRESGSEIDKGTFCADGFSDYSMMIYLHLSLSQLFELMFKKPSQFATLEGQSINLSVLIRESSGFIFPAYILARCTCSVGASRRSHNVL